MSINTQSGNVVIYEVVKCKQMGGETSEGIFVCSAPQGLHGAIEQFALIHGYFPHGGSGIIQCGEAEFQAFLAACEHQDTEYFLLLSMRMMARMQPSQKVQEILDELLAAIRVQQPPPEAKPEEATA